MEFNVCEMENIATMEIESIFEPSGWVEIDIISDCDCNCNDDD